MVYKLQEPLPNTIVLGGRVYTAVPKEETIGDQAGRVFRVIVNSTAFKVTGMLIALTLIDLAQKTLLQQLPEQGREISIPGGTKVNTKRLAESAINNGADELRRSVLFTSSIQVS